MHFERTTVTQYGIDVSSVNVPVSWPQVKAAAIGFVYVRGNEGTSVDYPSGQRQFRRAGMNQIPAGMYHAGQFAQDPAVSADAFAQACSAAKALNKGCLIPAVDMSTNGASDAANWIRAFVAEFATAAAYAGPLMVRSGGFGSTITVDSAWQLWVCDLTVPAGQPGYNTSQVAIHQYSASVSFSGVGAFGGDYAMTPIQGWTI